MTTRQKRLRRMTAAFALLAFLSGAANAQPVAPAAFTRAAVHNNSLMAITSDPTGFVRITYNVPRPGMAAIGVQPGTQLVGGYWIGPNQFSGTAIVFAPRCATVFPYHVEGGVGPDGALHLFGPAPIISPYCTIWSYAPTGNSDLVFWPYQG
jgi:hypothetical protein